MASTRGAELVERYPINRFGLREPSQQQDGLLEFVPKTQPMSRQKLERCSAELAKLMDDNIFVADSLWYASGMFTPSASAATRSLPETSWTQHLDHDKPRSLCEETRSMTTRIKDLGLVTKTNLASLQTLMTALLVRRSLLHLDRTLGEPGSPEIFLRAFSEKRSHTRFYPALGLTASKGSRVKPDATSATLQNSATMDATKLKNHFEKPENSDLITLSESPADILKLPWLFERPEDCKVMLINASKMSQCGVLFGRNSTLAEHYGVDLSSFEGRVLDFQCVARTNWAAYRWIPAQCIQKLLSLAEFRSLCAEKDITQDCLSGRLTLADLKSNELRDLAVQIEQLGR